MKNIPPNKDFPEDDLQEEQEFVPCEECDGHPACEDFGCAIALGLGRMVKKDLYPGINDWGSKKR
jgi:hypothetical protein